MAPGRTLIAAARIFMNRLTNFGERMSFCCECSVIGRLPRGFKLKETVAAGRSKRGKYSRGLSR